MEFGGLGPIPLKTLYTTAKVPGKIPRDFVFPGIHRAGAWLLGSEILVQQFKLSGPMKERGKPHVGLRENGPSPEASGILDKLKKYIEFEIFFLQNYTTFQRPWPPNAMAIGNCLYKI
jgi:hypothetical protein